MSQPLVVKFGGDALATPERIAAAARRLAVRRGDQPVVAVASARRGVTDHLLGLVEQVREAVGAGGERSAAAGVASDRAVASGELVAAALLALALADLGVPAVVLDAREAGLGSDGQAGGATLSRVRPARLVGLLARGVVPVVTGFQGWHRGRITTLGRGGSDITAVALAAALGAEACELVKEPGALHTADPKLVPEARPIPRASLRFVTEIALAGARVLHHSAAGHAEQSGVPLRFTSLQADGEPSSIIETEAGEDAGAVIYGGGYHGIGPATGEHEAVATVSVVSGSADAAALRAAARAAAARTGGRLLRTADRPHALAFLVPAEEGRGLVRALHSALSLDLRPGESRQRAQVGSG